jgi:hypothetical protein
MAMFPPLHTEAREERIKAKALCRKLIDALHNISSPASIREPEQRYEATSSYYVDPAIQKALSLLTDKQVVELGMKIATHQLTLIEAYREVIKNGNHH